jgi:Zn-dependent peptidase ImmA (M78 family)
MHVEIKGSGANQTQSDMKKERMTRRAKKLAPSRKYVNRIMDWCLQNYGKSKHNREFPEVKYRSAKYMNEDPMTMAYYDEDEGVIFINKDDHKSLKVLVNTMIHEYTHYLQNSHHYHVLSLYLPYRKHPLEIEADRVANRDTKKCLREILG